MSKGFKCHGCLLNRGFRRVAESVCGDLLDRSLDDGLNSEIVAGIHCRRVVFSVEEVDVEEVDA